MKICGQVFCCLGQILGHLAVISYFISFVPLNSGSFRAFLARPIDFRYSEYNATIKIRPFSGASDALGKFYETLCIGLDKLHESWPLESICGLVFQ